MANIHLETVKGFGREWSAFTQEAMADGEREDLFEQYFSLIDFHQKPEKALDFGCGSGRWSALAAARVCELVAADASAAALQVARRNVRAPNAIFVQAEPETLPYPDSYFDLIFSLGVLHHVPDTAAAIASLARKLRAGGTLLLYLYYAFDDRPAWFRRLWQVSDLGRRVISKLPFSSRYVLSQLIAFSVYWPLARIAKYFPVSQSWPLRFYADRSLYVMRTDALDRFGTKLEKRFTRQQITAMLLQAGLGSIIFSDAAPRWICRATKK